MRTCVCSMEILSDINPNSLSALQLSGLFLSEQIIKKNDWEKLNLFNHQDLFVNLMHL